MKISLLLERFLRITNISVIGAGTWGTAISNVLADNGHSVTLYHYDEKFVRLIDDTRAHPNLNGALISKRVSITSHLEDISDSDFIFIAIPTNSIRQFLDNYTPAPKAMVVSLSKGFEIETMKVPSEVISEVTGLGPNHICALSGPSHAEEVYRKVPTAIVAASSNVNLSTSIQRLLSSNYFRVYTNNDIMGVEIAGAMKNVISIASGVCIGLGFGDNTIAALVSRGLNEIVRLGHHYKAPASTFYGLAGVGDLAVTAFSRHSRNREFGIAIGKGEISSDCIRKSDMVVEGYYTSKALQAIIDKNNLDMPISDQIYSILYEDLCPKEAIMSLMTRDLKHENN